MMQKFIKKLSLLVILSSLSVGCFFSITYADDGSQESDLNVNGFNIMPEVEDEAKLNAQIKAVGSEGGYVWDHYNDEATRMSTSEQLATGIMNWDTIFNYLVFVVQFLSQLGLVIGVVFIMYAGYMYMVSVFKGGKVPTETVKNAIIGVIIVIFSYAIMKTLTSFIGLS